MEGARSTPASDRSFQCQVAAIPTTAPAAAMKWAAGKPSVEASCPQSALPAAEEHGDKHRQAVATHPIRQGVAQTNFR
jgi:type IV secretory pathway TrbL component